MRSIAQLIADKLDRVAVPVDELGDQLFTEDNPGYISDEATQEAIADVAATSATILLEVVEIDQHFHNDENWWGAVAAPTESLTIDLNVNRPFVALSGNNAWGAGIPIIGSRDNPVKPWQTKFDLHRVIITEPTNATAWRLRFLYGDQSLEEAAQARRYTEIMFIAVGVGSNVGGPPLDVRFPPIPVGWRVWAQAWNATDEAQLDFFVGVHGYPVIEYGD